MTALLARRAMLMALASLLAHPASSDISIKYDSKRNQKVVVRCDEYTLENLPPLTTMVTYGAVLIDGCPQPQASYAVSLLALNINVTSVQKLSLLMKSPTDLNKTHFAGLSIKSLMMSNSKQGSSQIDVSTIDTLEELSIWGNIRSPPRSEYLKEVVLYLGESSGVWRDCAGLRKLELDRWTLTEAEGPGWLSRCQNLKEVNVENMPPEMVRRALAGEVRLDTLSVRSGSVVDSPWPLSATMFAGVKEIRKLTLSYNKLSEIHRSALPSMVEYLDLSKNELRNTTALLTALAPLHKLRSLNLNENKQLDFCALETSTADWTTTSLVTLVAPLLEELFLSKTNLQQLNCFGHWKSLKFLDVSNNGILIQQLDLNKLAISRADARMTAESLFPDGTQRRHMRLAGNSFACTCENWPLLKTLLEHGTQVQDYNHIACAGTEDVFLRDFELDNFCDVYESVTRPTWHIVLGGLLVSSAAALALSGALCCRYKRQLRVFLFTRGLCLSYLREEPTDADSGRQFDAFVSFCHLDDEFVTEHLLPGLQDYKLCIHYRDWIAGEFIAAQITRSIEQSRRTIIVLSRNFLDSMWGMLEFRTAHATTRQEGRPRLVVVLVDDVLDDERLDSELRAYLATNTYVRWGERWFWNKLRFALPHRPHPSPGEPVLAIQYPGEELSLTTVH